MLVSASALFLARIVLLVTVWDVWLGVGASSCVPGGLECQWQQGAAGDRWAMEGSGSWQQNLLLGTASWMFLAWVVLLITARHV